MIESDQDNLIEMAVWLLDITRAGEAERLDRVATRLSLSRNEFKPTTIALLALTLAHDLAVERLGQDEADKQWVDLLFWGGPNAMQAGVHSAAELLDNPLAARRRLKHAIEQDGAITVVAEAAVALRNTISALWPERPVEAEIEGMIGWLVGRMFGKDENR